MKSLSVKPHEIPLNPFKSPWIHHKIITQKLHEIPKNHHAEKHRTAPAGRLPVPPKTAHHPAPEHPSRSHQRPHLTCNGSILNGDIMGMGIFIVGRYGKHIGRLIWVHDGTWIMILILHVFHILLMYTDIKKMWKTAWFPLQIVDFSDLWYLPQGNMINNNGISWQNQKKSR